MSPGGPRRRRRHILGWLLAIQLLAMAAVEMGTPFWPIYLRDLGHLSPPELAAITTLVYAGPLLTALVTTPFWGRLGDRLGHRPMVLRALLALAACHVWIGWTDSLWQIVAARLVQGGLAGFIAAAQAYAMDIVRGAARTIVISRLHAATACGTLLGPLCGGLLYAPLGFSGVILSGGGLCLVCALAACLALPDPRRRGASERAASPASPPAISEDSEVSTRLKIPQPTQPMKSAKTTKASEIAEPRFRFGSLIAGLCIGIVAVQTGKSLPQSYLGLFAEQVLLAPPWLTGVIYGAPAVGLMLGASFFGRYFSRQPSTLVLQRLAWACWICVLLSVVQAMSRDPWSFLVARLLWGIALAALLPILFGLLSRHAGTRQGFALALGNSTAKAGGLAGMLLGGATIAWMPIAYSLWPMAAAYAVAACCLHALKKTDAACDSPISTGRPDSPSRRRREVFR